MILLIITQKYDINDSNLGAFIDWWDKLAEKAEKVYVLALEKRSEPKVSNMEVIPWDRIRAAIPDSSFIFAFPEARRLLNEGISLRPGYTTPGPSGVTRRQASVGRALSATPSLLRASGTMAL